MKFNIDDVLKGRIKEIDKQIKIAGRKRDKQKLYQLGVEKKKILNTLKCD